MSLTESERFARLRLIRSDNIGPITFRQLLQHYSTAESALEALPDIAKRGGRGKPLHICSRKKAEDEWQQLEKLGVKLLYLGEADYPERLAAINDAPPILLALGNPHLLHQPNVAMVGARSASAAALKITQQLAEELGQAGRVIVSGMARGVDAQAHKASLASGSVAVLAGGIDVVYPEENAELYQALTEQGVIVSEAPCGTSPMARHFPRRNRIISGLCAGVVVIDASQRSGSLITARFAAEQGREVMAVPNSPLDARGRGSNALIQDGAVLVQTADDVLHTLDNIPKAVSEPPQDLFSALPQEDSPKTEERQRVRELLSTTPVLLDDLAEMSDLSVSRLLAIVLELEVAGEVERNASNEVLLLGIDSNSNI